MGLIILIAAGATLGWLASILLRREQPRDILRNIAAGAGGAVVGGGLSNGISILGGLGLTGLLVGLVAAAAAIAVLNLAHRGALAGSDID